MFDLPLFPLNTVLFPGTPVSLHIFEPRYKDMINQCIEAKRPFGVVLIQRGQEARGPVPEPHTIGCTAHITQVERLEDGRLNIVAVGLERFQIHDLKHDRPYLVGHVEPYPLHAGDMAALRAAGNRLRPWVERYLGLLSQINEDIRFDPRSLPAEPLALAYLAASLVQIPTNQKQQLLALTQAAEFLSSVHTIYRREIALTQAIIERDQKEAGFFSLN